MGLIERCGALESVDRAIDSAAGGCGSLLMVEGAAGLGKTAVLAAATARARHRGFSVLTAAGRPMESDLPYEVVLQLFERAVSRANPDEGLLGGHASVAAAIFDRRPGSKPRRPSDQAVIHALYWLTSNLCWPRSQSERRPLALVVDDLHWVDGPSLGFLAYLARRLEDLPITVVAARRPTEPNQPTATLSRLFAEECVVTVELKPLSSAGALQMLEHRNPAWSDPALGGACHSATGGNPFLLHSLLDELDRSKSAGNGPVAEDIENLAPEAVLNSVIDRLTRLGPDATALAQAVAVLDHAPLATVICLAGVAVEAASPAADALVDAEILAAGEPIAFAHPLVRSAVEAKMGPFSRAQAHLRAARLLGADPADVSLVASHLMKALPSEDPWVVDRLRAAAAVATEVGATAVAARLLDRALHEPPSKSERYRVLRDLAAAETAAGLDGAEEHLRAALPLAPDPPARVRTQMALGAILYSSGRHRDAAEMFEAARSGLAPDDAMGPLLEVLAAAASILLPDRSTEAGARLSELAAEPGLARTDASAMAAMNATICGRTAVEVRALAQPALESFRQGQSAALDPALGVSSLSFALVTTDDLGQSEALATATIESSRKRGAADVFAWASHLRAWTYYLQGRLAEAIADVESALAATSVAMHEASGLSVLALACLEVGEVEHASAAVKQALALPLESKRWSDWPAGPWRWPRAIRAGPSRSFAGPDKLRPRSRRGSHSHGGHRRPGPPWLPGTANRHSPTRRRPWPEPNGSGRPGPWESPGAPPAWW